MQTDLPILLVLLPGFPKDENDTTCLPAQQAFIKAFHKNHPWIRIMIYSFQYPYEKKEYTWNGIEVKSFGGSNKGGFARLFLWGRIEKDVRALASKNKVKAILSFWAGECALVGKRMATKFELPFYCWMMGQDARPDNRYMKRIRSLADEMIAISDSIREECFKSHGVKPAHVIPLGIDPVDFKDPAGERDIDIIGVGSLIALKQFDIFIRVVEQLKNPFPGIKALLVGKGPEQNRLKEIITDSGLEDNIEMKGELSHQQVLEMMQRSKILLHPSYYEGFSGVCLEALYAGARVISFCRPMNEEIPNWHIVENEDEMIEKANEILDAGNIFEPVLYYSAEQSAERFYQVLNT